jgi:excisionase family DNA binding protein
MNNMLPAVETGPMKNPLLIPAREAARLLSVSERTVWTLTKDGAIPCLRIGRRVLYDPGDLRAWIDRQKRFPNEGLTTTQL